MPKSVRLLACLLVALCCQGAVGQITDGQVTAAQVTAAQSTNTIEVAEAQVSLIQNTFVATSIAGIVDRVRVSEGDRVEPGDPLIQLDTELALTELEAAKAAHEAARLQTENDVNIRFAQRTMEVRQRELEQSHEANRLHSGTVSELEIGKQQLEVDQARLAIEQAEHDQMVAGAKVREKYASSRIAEAQLRRHGVATPVRGVVVEVAVEPGEWVDRGKPVVRIISLDPIRIECFIDGTAFGDELVGCPVEFFPNRGQVDPSADDAAPLTGKVTFVSPEVHPVTGQARLWATVANPGFAVRAGRSGRLHIGLPSGTAN